MRTVMRIATGLLAGTLLLAGGAGSGFAEPTVTSERVSFDASTVRGAGAHVRGMLRIPETGAARLPAVLVLHTSAGASRRCGSRCSGTGRPGPAPRVTSCR
jgi:hypothetical protein